MNRLNSAIAILLLVSCIALPAQRDSTRFHGLRLYNTISNTLNRSTYIPPYQQRDQVTLYLDPSLAFFWGRTDRPIWFELEVSDLIGVRATNLFPGRDSLGNPTADILGLSFINHGINVSQEAVILLLREHLNPKLQLGISISAGIHARHNHKRESLNGTLTSQRDVLRFDGLFDIGPRFSWWPRRRLGFDICLPLSPGSAYFMVVGESDPVRPDQVTRQWNFTFAQPTSPISLSLGAAFKL